jgi:hypothetical protein
MDERLRQRFAAELRGCESELGLPDGFLDRLVLEDDWSLVIKAHALVEATITHLLTAAVDVRLRKVFERLELSDRDKGKIVFAEALGLIGGAERRFIRQLSEVRNKLVHDVRQVSFTFDNYLQSLDKNQRSSFLDAVCGFLDPGPERDRYQELVLRGPIVGIWNATIQVLTRALGEARRQKALAVLWETATWDPARPT